MEPINFQENQTPRTTSVPVEALPIRGFEPLIDAIANKTIQHAEVVGSDSTLTLAAALCQAEMKIRPHLVIVASHEQAQVFQDDVCFLDPHQPCHVLPPFDVDIYSNLYPNRKLICQRISWLYHAQNATGGEIFVASVEALLQGTLPFSDLHKNISHFQPNTDLPEHLPEILEGLGYNSVPVVEDIGTFAIRGGIVDIFSPAHKFPVRLELFGDTIESMRFFDPQTQRSLEAVKKLTVIPAREALYSDEKLEDIVTTFRQDVIERKIPEYESLDIIQSLTQKQYFPGIDFLLPIFYPELSQPVDHFSSPTLVWQIDPVEIFRSADDFMDNLKSSYREESDSPIHWDYKDLYADPERINYPEDSILVTLSKIHIEDVDEKKKPDEVFEYRTSTMLEFQQQAKALQADTEKFRSFCAQKLGELKESGFSVFIAANTSSQSQRLHSLFDSSGLLAEMVGENEYLWHSWSEHQRQNQNLVHIVPRSLRESIRLSPEKIIFLRDEDFFGRKQARRDTKSSAKTDSRAHALSFGDLKVGDYIVHKMHGIGVYEGLKVMPIQGVDAEFIQISYKGKDRLYLPVYRVGQIQKFAGPSNPHMVDKLGGQAWEKTKTKVRSHLRDVASELLKLYAKRSQVTRPPYPPPDQDYIQFESSFPYTETQDQLQAINDLISDLSQEKPMDRLICGDVGFGKTEVAMRGAFKVVQDGRQVCIIAPTTILSFQHFENFKKRFKNWPVKIASLNRFVPKAQQRKIVEEMKSGEVDVVIGTHRLLSKDIGFKDLGLLIVDEEQKFGVRHKEKLRRLKTSVDTLAMSATPIPRTLNLSLVGIRDLSLISTAPVDRLPTRTFVCKFDRETIRKAVHSEVNRGGQVFFLHNRVNSIYALHDELRSFLPDVRIAVAHGQMDESELEKTMLRFFNHEIDVLLCTTIIESGMDIPRANTMFIDNAHQFGLSQLYQLRGRVGRSKERAYCYLLIPHSKRIDKEAQERLKVIQENTALGSGLRIAHYDLELRGAGDILGEQQSGHINAVGYELYIDLLEEAVREVRGDPRKAEEIEPEINVQIPALIPDSYIPDIRVRLSYYKTLSDIQDPYELDEIEDELRDQFGKPPEPVLNLLGLMLIRKYCKDLGIKDLSSGRSSISLTFSEQTAFPPEKAIELTMRPNKKYSLTPDNRLNIRMNEIKWPKIYEELQYLYTLIPKNFQ